MKPNFTNAATLFLSIFLWQAAISQTTYAIHSSKNWSALSPSADWCTGCTFNIDAGVTLTLTSSVGCVNCTFNGGILVVNSSFSFQGGKFNVDSMAINSGASFQVSSSAAPVFSNGVVAIATGLTCQACTFTNETVRTSSNLTLQASGSFTTATLTGSTFIINGGQLYANEPFVATGSTITLNNTATLKGDNGQFSLSSSSVLLNNKASWSATAGPIVVKNNSEILIGDGSLASTASVLFNMGGGTNGVNVYDNSYIKVSNGSNAYQNNASYIYHPTTGLNTTYSTSSNTVSCGSGHANTCKPNFVYGCATLGSIGASACTLLAIADINLSVAPVGSDKVALSWTDEATTPADHYLVQRNTGNNSWTTINTINAGAYASGSYHFTDADAPAGLLEYRIARIDGDGKTLYSAVNSITITRITAPVSIHPNPATGGTFYINTNNTAETVVNVFTMTGQLLLRTTLKGSTQYPVHLPVQAQSMGSVVVQTIGQTGTWTFTVLVK